MSDSMQTTRTGARPWVFFLLLFVLSLPLYALDAVSGRLPVATFLPMSALMTFLPMITALVLVSRESGAAGAKAFLISALDYRQIKSVGWFLTALLLMPLVFIVEYVILRVGGRALSDVEFFSIAQIAAFTLMFFVGAIGEELGWQGYVYAGIKNGRSALETALIIGVVWALWHVIPFLEMGRSLDWTLWQCASAIALRIVIVWLFVNAGQCVLVAVLFHTTINMPWGVFTASDASFDPFVQFMILAIVAVIVVVAWGPSTLARFRYVKTGV